MSSTGVQAVKVMLPRQLASYSGINLAAHFGAAFYAPYYRTSLPQVTVPEGAIRFRN